MVKCNANFCELTDAKFEAGEDFRANKCAMMTESRRFFRTRLCLYIESFRQESVGRRVFFDFCGSFRDLARESCIKGCNLRERRSV